MTLIAICDDEPAIRKTLAEILQDEHHDVTAVESGEELLGLLRSGEKRVDAIFLDIWLPGIDGVETLTQLKADGFDAPVIMISGHATLESAVKATRLGAFDFLEKPLNLDRVVISLNNALRQTKLDKRLNRLVNRLPKTQMIGDSTLIQQLKADIQLAAEAPARVLILGESGSGKELAARSIHELSPRRDEPFVEMNCAAIPEELIESELFGHVKGSFTGAIENRQGKFEEADRGTLFLDEIGDMSLQTQAKVLRVLQEQRFQRIGSNRTIAVDVRVIAATNKDLEQEIQAGRFRKDLFYRLNVIPITIPPLRERLSDLGPLCRHFAAEFAASYGRPALHFTPSAIEALTGYAWPGNVRELRNIVERLMIMCRKPEVTSADLPQATTGHTVLDPVFPEFSSLKDARDAFERSYIMAQLDRFDGNVTKTAEALQLERSHLHRKLKQLGIKDLDT
ncbi:MAG: sigma-54-dependent Fis family transcriptional regulator [Acidobacteria bacterium]|nr:sigma-54-dependent Fis family transcriptional regulator [Acidobacteriota bacterium]